MTCPHSTDPWWETCIAKAQAWNWSYTKRTAFLILMSRCTTPSLVRFHCSRLCACPLNAAASCRPQGWPHLPQLGVQQTSDFDELLSAQGKVWRVDVSAFAEYIQLHAKVRSFMINLYFWSVRRIFRRKLRCARVWYKFFICAAVNFRLPDTVIATPASDIHVLLGLSVRCRVPYCTLPGQLLVPPLAGSGNDLQFFCTRDRQSHKYQLEIWNPEHKRSTFLSSCHAVLFLKICTIGCEYDNWFSHLTAATFGRTKSSILVYRHFPMNELS